MLFFSLSLIRPKVISFLVLNQIKSKLYFNLSTKLFNRHFFRVMDQIIDEINSNHLKIITKIRDLEQKIQLKELSNKSRDKQVLTSEDITIEKQRLVDENNGLKLEVNRLIKHLNELEAKRDPNSALISNSIPNSVVNISETTNESIEKPSNLREEPKPVDKSEKKSAKKEPKPKPNKNTAEEEKPLDASRLDLRVGRIIEAKRHPDADSLYVEQIDCGEDKPRTVVSGLVRFVPLEEMENRLVVILCNLKPAKMRGVLSEAMVMCASSPESVEILAPPEGSQPGDRVVFDKYPGTPDSQLNPKKKIWEQIAPDLKTDSECVATYKGEPFKIETKGVVKAKSLANVSVK